MFCKQARRQIRQIFLEGNARMKRTLYTSLVAVLMVLMLLLSACATDTTAATTDAAATDAAATEAPAASTEPQYITKEDLKADIDAGGTGYIILDVRKAADYAESHIQGAYSADVDPTISNSDDATSTANLKAAPYSRHRL